MPHTREDYRTGSLTEQFGQIDIYLFDQLLRGRITPDMSVLDAGCGNGRNLVCLLKQRCTVFGVDASARAVGETRELARRLDPQTPADRFRVERLEALWFEDGTFGAVICSAVLHCADRQAHFERMLGELWRVLAPGGRCSRDSRHRSDSRTGSCRSGRAGTGCRTARTATWWTKPRC